MTDDEGADAPPVVVLSERLWARRFGADPALIGRTIVLDGLARTVIGVVPQDFRFPHTDTSLWVPAAYSPPELANTNAYNYYAVARLRPGVDLGAAQAELDSVALAMQSESRTGPASRSSRSRVFKSTLAAMCGRRSTCSSPRSPRSC